MSEQNKYGWVNPFGWTWLWLHPAEKDEDKPRELRIMGTGYASQAQAKKAIALDGTKGETHHVVFFSGATPC